MEPVATLYFGASADADAARCAELGAALAGRADRVTLLVMGDASARRSLKGPGYLDERAPSYDASVARALADADTEALLGLDPALSATCSQPAGPHGRCWREQRRPVVGRRR